MQPAISEDRSRLVTIEMQSHLDDLRPILHAIVDDCVVLVKNVSASEADHVVCRIAENFGLSASLSLQAKLASVHGHRSNIGKYFMSVNQRHAYQFVTPHCEGFGYMRMQLAFFYCFENSTDGGETILFNIDGSSGAWSMMREKVTRISPRSRAVTAAEVSRMKLKTGIRSANDIVRRGDVVLREYESEISGVKIATVLGKAERSRCQILGKPIYVLWDNIASSDRDEADMFRKILAESGLLREPPGGLPTSQLDKDSPRRLYSSGVDYTKLFRCKLTHKLAPGELAIHNNYSWAHATANWTPNSGTRIIAAAFA